MDANILLNAYAYLTNGPLLYPLGELYITVLEMGELYLKKPGILSGYLR